jgi:invasion protein IalB
MLPVVEGTTHRRLLKGAVLAGALAAFAMVAPASAQTQQTQQPQAAPAEGGLGSWIKLCAPDTTEGDATKEICLVTQEVRTDTGEFLASISVQETKTPDGKRLIRAAVPLGTLIQPGIRVQVDEGTQVPGKYVICLPNACYAELEIEDAFINNLKKGNNLVVLVINNQGKPVGIGLTLTGFTKAWDGPPVPVEQLAQQRQKLQEELQKRAEEARKKLLEQQQAGKPAGQQPAAQ